MPGKTHRIGPNLIDTAAAFATEENCHAYLSAARWPNGIRCLKCDHDKVSKFTVKGKKRVRKDGSVNQSPDRFMIQCLNPKCKYQFQATTGTLFSDTHLPLSKWMLAVALLCNGKKSISAKQMERDLNVSYKTAWYLNHRIRQAMEEGTGLLGGVVEVDATFVGGKYDLRRKRERRDKQAVVGLMQRGTELEHSKVKAFTVISETGPIMMDAIEKNVAPDASMVSDESGAYRTIPSTGRVHGTVNHISKEWVRGNIHTQGLEGFWSLLKRGIIGSFHQVSVKHLDRYISEFQFKFNNRREENIFAAVVIGLVIKSALRYADLTAKSAELLSWEKQYGHLFDDEGGF